MVRSPRLETVCSIVLDGGVRFRVLGFLLHSTSSAQQFTFPPCFRGTHSAGSQGVCVAGSLFFICISRRLDRFPGPLNQESTSENKEARLWPACHSVVYLGSPSGEVPIALPGRSQGSLVDISSCDLDVPSHSLLV